MNEWICFTKTVCIKKYTNVPLYIRVLTNTVSYYELHAHAFYTTHEYLILILKSSVDSTFYHIYTHTHHTIHIRRTYELS